MFRFNTIVTIFRIENIDLNNLNRYLFRIDRSINKQDNWLSIQCDIDNFLYFIDDDCLCVIEMHDLESFNKSFNDLFERNLSRYRWQNRKRKSYSKIKRLVCLLIRLYHIYQFVNVIFIFFRVQNIQLSQSIVDVNHNNHNFVNKLKYHNIQIRRIKIVLANQFNSIKIRKSL